MLVKRFESIKKLIPFTIYDDEKREIKYFTVCPRRYVARTRQDWKLSKFISNFDRILMLSEMKW